MTNNNRLIRPDAINIETVYAPGPLAQPACTVLQAPGQMKMLVMGGLTKVEHLAGQIAGSLCQPGVLSQAQISDAVSGFGKEADAAFERHVAKRSVSLAEAIIAESERRTKERQQPMESE